MLIKRMLENIDKSIPLLISHTASFRDNTEC